jgi:hypothetical protein
MLTRGFNFFLRGEKEKLSSCTNAVVCGGEKASSFAFFSNANVLAFVRWIASPFAPLVLWDLSVVAKLLK